MAPSARLSSSVCCCVVDRCLDLLYDLDEWKGRLSFIILHGTLPTSVVQGTRDTHINEILCHLSHIP